MSKTLEEIKKMLSERDSEALTSIYLYRCLTIEQIYELHYKQSLRDPNETVSNSYCKSKIKDFLDYQIIEKGEHSEDVYFLTSRGVDIVRGYLDLPVEVYNYKQRRISSGYYRASELKISPKYINHQLALNQFMVDFITRKPGVYWKYYDEKHISKLRNIRPDGMLTLMDTDYFLEMDMATESKKQLYEKWENYRRFLNSSEFDCHERKIVVLFIIENTAQPQARIDLIKKTLGDRLMDKIDKNFDIIIDSKENLINYLYEKINYIHQDIKSETDTIMHEFAREGFSVALGDGLSTLFNGLEYELYCRKIDKNNNVVVENNRIQEYLVDSYKYCPFSVLKKIAFFDNNNVFYKNNLGRTFTYIVVAENEDIIFRDLKIMDLVVVSNIFYTTIDRLRKFSFPKAIFQFDFLGNIYHFTDYGLENREYETSVDGLISSEAEPAYEYDQEMRRHGASS